MGMEFAAGVERPVCFVPGAWTILGRIRAQSDTNVWYLLHVGVEGKCFRGAGGD